MAEEIWFRENVTAEDWEAFAKECEAQAHAVHEDKMRVWEEDGYTFYHNAMQQRWIKQAKLARNHGIDYVEQLVDANGNVVDASKVNGKYGYVWLIKNGEQDYQWVNVSQASTVAKQQKFYASKGFQLAHVYYRFCEYRGEFRPAFNAEPIRIEVCK